MKPWPHGDPDAVVRSILASPVYHLAASPRATAAQPSLAYTLWRWFVEHVLRPLVGPIAHAARATSAYGSAIGIAVIAITLAILTFALFRLIVAFTGSRRERLADSPRVPLLAFERELASAQWRARARDAARAGDFGRGIAALFRAALVELDERAIVAFDATRTPGEYRRLVRSTRPPAAQPFNDLADRFVRAAYAEGVSTPEDFAAAERAYVAFEPAIVAA